MSALEIVTRIVLTLARHPAVQAAAKAAVRSATAEIVRQVRHRTRAGTKSLHVS